MPSALITGHLGFIGGHVYKTLKKDGWDVVGLDKKDYSDCVDSDNFPYGEKIDVIFHLACDASIPNSLEHPFESNANNIGALIQVLEFARKQKCPVIYSSSSSIYGDVQTPYSLQKSIGEQYLKLYWELYKVPSVSLRYFNVYGEGMPLDGPYSAAIALFREAKAKDEELPVMGGNQTRDFTFVGDIVNANIAAMENSSVGKGEVINIGGGQNYSIEEVAKAISKKIKYLPQRVGEPMHTLADISKAKKLLSFEPTTNLIEWLKSQ